MSPSETIRGRRRDRRADRPGFLITLLPVLLLVLIAGLFALSWMTQHQRRGVNRYRLGQEALALAEAGLTQAQAFLSSDGGAALRREVLDAILQGPATEVEFERTLDFANLRDLTADDPGLGLEVSIRLAGFRPLFPGRTSGGFVPDPAECTGRIEIVSRGTSQGVVRSAVRARPVRVVHILPPVLSKFALHVAESEGLAAELNCLRYESDEGIFRDAASGARTTPLVVYADLPGAPGAAPGVDAETDRLLPLASGLPAGVRTALDSGWIFLGGPDAWHFNVTFGSGTGGPHEEHHLLRRAEYVFPSPVLGPPFQQKCRLLGFAHGVGQLPFTLEAGVRFVSPSTGEAVPDRTPLVRLTGDLRNVTPTLVLGPVHRRYLAFDKIRRGSSGPFTSLVHVPDRETFDATVGPAFRALTGKGYEAYRLLMARVVEEPFNRTYDHVVTSLEQSDPLAPGLLSAGETPFRPRRTLADVAATQPVLLPGGAPSSSNSGAFYPPAPARSEEAAEVDRSSVPPLRIARRLESGRSELVFLGDVGRLDDLEAVLLARVSRHYPSRRELEDGVTFEDVFVRGPESQRELDLGGHVVKVPGDLSIGGALVSGGGMILADGDIHVTGPIDAVEDEALSLVSLRGDIRIETAAPVQACLVAPRGQLVPPAAGGLRILGSVACRNLANFPLFIQNPGPKWIAWDRRLDPTRQETHRRFYRLVLGEEEARYMIRN